MSGPMQPAINQLLRLPQGQTRKPLGDDRVPQSNEPLQRSDAAKRIIEARRMGVDPSKLTQPPGYRPKGDRMPAPQLPQQQAPNPPTGTQPPQAPVTRSAEAPTQAPMQNVPMPRPRPQMPDDGNFATRFNEEVGGLNNASAAMRQVIGDKMRGGMPVSAPDPMADAKARLAQAMAAQRSGGGQSAAPAAQGGVTPPPSQPAVSPPQAPPPAFRPITGPDSEYIVRAPELEGKKGKKDDKPAKSTKKSSEVYGNAPTYYDILGVQRGDNRAAAQAMAKLQQRAQEDPGSLTREEYNLYASSFKNPSYNLSREEDAIKKFFGDTPVPQSKKGAKDEGRVSQTGPADGGSYAAKVQPQGSVADRFVMVVDPAQSQAYAAIDTAGAPPKPRLPTQESVNEQKKFNPQADVADIAAVEEGDD